MAVVPLSRDVGDFRVGVVSYNGVAFPPAIHSKAFFEPVYDDSGRISKYLKVHIDIEAYIFPGCFNTPVNDVIPYLLAGHVSEIESDVTTDDVMSTIRTRLAEPCQHLQFTYQGAGNLSLNAPANTGPMDVNNGPKPNLITWKPLTNKMAYVHWHIEACYSPCAALSTGATPSNIAQFPFEVSDSVDAQGLTVRTTTGSYEIALTRIPGPTGIDDVFAGKAGASKPFNMNYMKRDILKYFPLMKYFKRENQTFTLSNDRKTIDFTITDVEINSDEAYGRGIADEDVTLSTSGQLMPGAFRRWSVSLKGSIDVMAGYPKSVAYDEINRLFTKYFVERATSGNKPSVANKIAQDYKVKIPKTIAGNSIPILRSVKFDDSIFGRNVQFSFNWDLYVSLDTFFKATGLFQPLSNTDARRNNQWDQWVYSAEQVLNNPGRMGLDETLNMTQARDIVVSLCTPLIGKPYGPREAPGNVPEEIEKRKDPKGGDTFDSTSRSTEDMWCGFGAGFYNIIGNNTLTHFPLYSLPPTQENPVLNKKTKQQIDYPRDNVPEPESPSDDPIVVPRPITHKIRPTEYQTVFTGYAIRLNYPVPYFEASYQGNQPLTKVGTDYIKPFLLGSGVDVVTGKTYSIHGLVWEKRYTLPGRPENATIVSDGHKTLFA